MGPRVGLITSRGYKGAARAVPLKIKIELSAGVNLNHFLISFEDDENPCILRLCSEENDRVSTPNKT
jgi:hypothetical protein